MNKQLRVVLGKVYRIPVIGYLLEVVVIAVRLPALRARLRKLEESTSRPRQTKTQGKGHGPGDYVASSDQLSDHVAAFRQHLPALVRAIGSVGELSHQVAQLQAITRDLEAAARESDERIQRLERIISEIPEAQGRTGSAGQ
jgi:hypothetical protein